jgi:hypothetical protein
MQDSAFPAADGMCRLAFRSGGGGSDARHHQTAEDYLTPRRMVGRLQHHLDAAQQQQSGIAVSE